MIATGPKDIQPIPWRPALVTGAVVLLGYVLTLAPTVTFWDAGEFITAAKVVGIPHPPGTPLFVLLGHVWAMLLPIGEFAYRTNLLSATMSAAGAAFWYLTAFALLQRMLASSGPESGPAPGRDRRLCHLGAFAAVLISAFGLTNWQNSNETEVYAVSTFTIAVVTWLTFRWRHAREAGQWGRSEQLLLLMLYLMGLSLGNHLLALLVGPGVLAFLAYELRYHRRVDRALRRYEWSHLAVIASLWFLLVGVGLGQVVALGVGGVGYLAALVWSYRGTSPSRSPRFAVLALPVAMIGATPFLVLFLRAPQRPVINEADPSTVASLVAVMRRDQYPARSVLDDPTVVHGSSNPGRSIEMVGAQVENYVQYFSWQWAYALGGRFSLLSTGFDARLLVTLLFLLLGMRGAFRLHVRDPAAWWLLGVTFLITGLGLLIYMNFKPGHSIGYLAFPDPSQHEVRERDYFFVVSFVTWGVLAGLGLTTVVKALARRASLLALGGFALVMIPMVFNAQAASRRHGPSAHVAADFAYDMLNSVPPYGILFTVGDNDTFPLWWAQEVEGIRQDVTVVCLALAETEWYVRQLRDMPRRPFDPTQAPELWRRWPHQRVPTAPIHTMTDEDIRSMSPTTLQAPLHIQYAGGMSTILPEGQTLYGSDLVTIRVLQENFGRRPIAWGIGAAGNLFGLERVARQQGIVIAVDLAQPSETDLRYDHAGLLGVPVDLAMTQILIDSIYHIPPAGGGWPGVDRTAEAITATLALPLRQLGTAWLDRGDSAVGLRFLHRARELAPRTTADLLLPEPILSSPQQ